MFTVTVLSVMKVIEAKGLDYSIIGTEVFQVSVGMKLYTIMACYLPILYLEATIPYTRFEEQDLNVIWEAVNSVNLHWNRVKIALDEDGITFRVAEKVLSVDDIGGFIDTCPQEIEKVHEELFLACKVLQKGEQSDLESLYSKMMDPDDETYKKRRALLS